MSPTRISFGALLMACSILTTWGGGVGEPSVSRSTLIMSPTQIVSQQLITSQFMQVNTVPCSEEVGEEASENGLTDGTIIKVVMK